MQDLTPRRQAILGIVVREYIATATPVGSRTIAQRYGLGVSSATIRNEMAYLEEEGYLTHPHTSAGRVPTVKGYRYFVERLMEEVEVPLAERRMIRHQFHQAGMELEEWMRLSAAVLAHTARAAALVTAPRAHLCRLKHLDLISLRDPLVLLILVLQDGTVRQQTLTAAQPIAQEELSRMANKLNDLLDGLSRHEIPHAVPPLPALEEQVVEHMVDLMCQVDRLSHHEIYRYGLAHVLREPEFAEAGRARQVIHVVEQSDLLETILPQVALSRRGVQIVIGGQGRWEDLRDYSLVLARYGVVEEAMGVLGILGPIRMPYERAVSTVRYVADLMSDLLGQLYGC
jgi:heat-inducible transcriptional repressor